MRVPAKFRDGGKDLAPYDSSNLSADMHMMSHDLSLTDYVHIYASIHFGLGTPDKHNIMTSDKVVTTILHLTNRPLQIQTDTKFNKLMPIESLYNFIIIIKLINNHKK